MRNFTLTYPITVYSVDTEYATGSVKKHIFEGPPDNYDAHLIKEDKFIWRRDNKYTKFYIKKATAKKIGLSITRERIRLLNKQVDALKKILKETVSL
jgi:hypothetical protein